MIINLSQKAYQVLIVTGVFVTILYFIYGNILIQPNNYMLSSEGEALRSYYVMSTQLKSGNWIENLGMNYPFGEHLTYCDGQPLNTWIAIGLSKIFPSLVSGGVGFINVFTFGSLIIGCILLFLVLTDWKVPFFLAGIIAISIMLISPQSS